MQRQAEIQAKKAKLAELKRQRELREREFSSARQSIGPSPDLSKPPSSPLAAPALQSKEDLDSFISRLVGDDRRSSVAASPRTPSKSRPSTYNSPAQTDAGSGPSASSPAAASGAREVASSGTQTLAEAATTTTLEIRDEQPKREILTYSKAVQTDLSPPTRTTSPDSSDEQDGYTSRRRLSERKVKEREEQLRQNIRKEIEEELKTLKQGTSASDSAAETKQNFPVRPLTREEKDAVTSSNDFLDFVERSSKIIERALDEEYDVLADYRAGNRAGLDDDDEEVGAFGRKGRRVREVMQFYDERWSDRRMISDIAFSPKVRLALLRTMESTSAMPLHVNIRAANRLTSTANLILVSSSPNSSSQHTLKTALHMTRQASSSYGIHTCSHVLNMSSTPIRTSSLPNSPPFIQTIFSAALTQARSYCGIPAQTRLIQYRRRPSPAQALATLIQSIP